MPVLNVEGAQELVTPDESPVVGLLRVAGEMPPASGLPESEPAVLTLINPDEEAPASINLGELARVGSLGRFVERTPGMPEIRLDDRDMLVVPPLSLRLFVAD